MKEQELRDLAGRLADRSEVLDFETALAITRDRPAHAEKLVRDQEERKKLLEELARANERLHQAALELR